MAVYNGGPYLRTAIDSILQQTYADFHFLIVDDASTDNTREIVRSYQDGRIQLHCLEKNVGQTAALSIGLNLASTPWIARMDADDYSAPTRLEEQMGAIDADPSLDCVGTFGWMFLEDPSVIESLDTRPLCYPDIKLALLSASPIIHGSIVVRRAALLDVGGYNDRYRYSADLEMYDRLLEKYRAANIPKPLIGLRQHDNQGSGSIRAYDESIDILSQRLLNPKYSRKEVAIINSNLSRWHIVRGIHLGAERKYLELLKDLVRAFRVSPKTSPWCFLRVATTRMLGRRNYARLKRLLGVGRTNEMISRQAQ